MAEKTIFNNLDMMEAYLHKQALLRMTARGGEYRQALLDTFAECPGFAKLREALYAQRQRRSCDTTAVTQIDSQLKEVDDELERLTRETMGAHPELHYGQALKVAASEHPNLLRLRGELYRKIL